MSKPIDEKIDPTTGDDTEWPCDFLAKEWGPPCECGERGLSKREVEYDYCCVCLQEK